MSILRGSEMVKSIDFVASNHIFTSEVMLICSKHLKNIALQVFEYLLYSLFIANEFKRLQFEQKDNNLQRNFLFD